MKAFGISTLSFDKNSFVKLCTEKMVNSIYRATKVAHWSKRLDAATQANVGFYNLEKGVRTVNREEKRKATRELKAKGKTPDEIKKIIEFRETMAKQSVLPEGALVKLNVAQIKAHPNWEGMRDTYKQFIEDNENTEFTVEFEDVHKGRKIVCLKEDATEPKWFFWTGDLTPIN